MPRLLGLLVLPALLLAGCSSDAQVAPSADPTTAESPTTTGTPTSSAPTSADPLTFDSVGKGCASLPGRYIMWESFRTDRPLTLNGAELGSVAGIEVTARSVTEQPADVVGLTGMVKGPMPLKDRSDVGWSEREPLDGYAVEPGSIYYLFLHVRLRDGGSYDGVDVSWDDGQTTGTSRWDDKLEVRKDCV